MMVQRLVLTTVSAQALLLLSPLKADALLTYTIFQSGPDVVIKTSGSLNLPGNVGVATCSGGTILASLAIICTGVSTPDAPAFPISGPTSFTGPNINATSTSGISTILFGALSGGPYFSIAPAYSSGTPIVSSSTFAGQTLAGLGFPSPGLLGSWQLAGTPGEAGQIDVRIGESPATVPGPLPLFGAAAFFGWSRRLRRRLHPDSSSPAPLV